MAVGTDCTLWLRKRVVVANMECQTVFAGEFVLAVLALISLPRAGSICKRKSITVLYKADVTGHAVPLIVIHFQSAIKKTV